MSLKLKCFFVLVYCLSTTMANACYMDISQLREYCHNFFSGYPLEVVICRVNKESYYHRDEIGCADPETMIPNTCAVYNKMPLSHFIHCPEGDNQPESAKNPTIYSNNKCQEKGSIITVDTQSVSEVIRLLGTPYNLVYSSDRVKGNKSWNDIRIPITHSRYIENDLVNSEKLEIIIGDKIFNQTLSPAAGITMDFSWDGTDQGGNPVAGPMIAQVSVQEEYNFETLGISEDVCEFNVDTNQLSGGCGKTHGIDDLAIYNVERKSSVVVGSIFNPSKLISGWDISVRHHYDYLRKILFLGDGSTFNTTSIQRADGSYWVVSQNRNEVYVFDNSNKHIETKFGLTGTTKYSFTYDSSNRLISIADSYGKTTTLNYTAEGISTIAGPFGHTTSFSLDDSGYIATATNPASEQFRMSYSSGGLLTTFTTPNGTVSSMSYNPLGKLISDSSSEGSSLAISSSMEGMNRIIETATALGRVTQYSTKQSDDGKYTRNMRLPDAREFLYEESTNSTLSSQYYTNFKVQTNTQPDSRFNSKLRMPHSTVITTPQVTHISQYYESSVLNNPSDPFSLASLIQTFDQNSKITTHEFDPSNKTWLTTSPEGRIRTSTINSHEQITSDQAAGYLPVTYQYDLKGRIAEIAQGTARKTAFTYDETSGNLSNIRNSLNQDTSFSYDLAGRIIKQTLPDLREILFRYDLQGNLVSISPPGKAEHVFSYNGFDLINSYHPPYLPQYDTTSTNYFYNNDRQLTQIQRADGRSIDFNYSQTTGQIGTIVFPEGFRSFTFENGFLNQTISEDQISFYRNTSGTLVQSDMIMVDNKFFQLSYQYNSDFQASTESLQYWPVNFVYDMDGLLTGAGSQTYARATDSGLLTQTNLDQVTELYSYSSEYGELSSHVTQFSGASFYQESFTRDVLGRIITKTEKYGSGTEDLYQYSYDPTGRLSSVTLNGALKSLFEYDSNSNRISFSGTSGGGTSGEPTFSPGKSACVTTPKGQRCPGGKAAEKIPEQAKVPGLETSTDVIAVYDDQDRLVELGTKIFTYSANGELNSITDSATNETQNFVYDVFVNLKLVSLVNKEISYGVDAFDRRMWKKVNGILSEYFIWNKDNQLVGVANANGEVVSRFVYGSKSHAPDHMIRGLETFQIVTNYLGSPVLVVNSVTGEIAQEIKYDEWGNILSDSNPGLTPFGFAGCLYDQDTKLCRFGARDYDASIGRWLSKDPISFAGGDTNLYGYVLQDPINFIDPEGEALVALIPFLPYVPGLITGAKVAGAFVAAYALQKLTSWQLDKLKENTGRDPHGIKQDVLGKKAPISQWDLHIENDGKITVRPKNGGNPIDTGYDFNDLKRRGSCGQ